jgi:hypothetical protein
LIRSHPQLASTAAEFSTGDFEGCPAQGIGGDPILNMLKNRDIAPARVTSFEFAALTAALPNNLPTAHRKNWSESDASRAGAWESKGVVVEGYLVAISREGPESCNCRRVDRTDIHLWLAAAADAPAADAMITEVIPRLMAAHENWRAKTLDHFVQQHSRVRITGWLMWDEYHAGQIGEHRKTLWEIHPIHKIEVLSGGHWRAL